MVGYSDSPGWRVETTRSQAPVPTGPAPHRPEGPVRVRKERECIHGDGAGGGMWRTEVGAGWE